MSKDKGVKNSKKPIALKTLGKEKAISSYKAESTQSSSDIVAPKGETKAVKKSKS
jgi:hypothetical protein